MIYPENFEEKLGLDKIRKIVSDKCVTQSARDKVTHADFVYDIDEVRERLSLTNEMKTIVMMESSFPDSGYVDVSVFLSKIKAIGSFLSALELYQLKQALETVKHIINFFKNKESEQYPYLTKLALKVFTLPEISDYIDRIIDKNGKIRDNASPELQKIRKSISEKQSLISKRMQAILKMAQSEGIVDDDSGVSIRDGHAVIPVSAMYKRKIKGIVTGESSTGKTVFIEPLEVVELNNEVREYEFAEQREIAKILTAATDFLRPYYDSLETSADLIAQIDFIRAKAHYAIDVEATMPLLSAHLQINFIKARHPLLMAALKKEKKEVVPLNVNLNTKQRILLISGPNAGGKSVCIKTAGLLQYMLQCGFLIPVSEISEMAMFKNIFIDIGDEQSIENDLSTYSSHLKNMKHFMRYANDKTLILIDEFGTGTEPSAGGAIAEAVLADVLKKGSFGLITTHYNNLKYFASSNEHIINGAMLFDVQNIQPMFKLETGIPGSSFAFEIARKTGLPEEVIKYAQEIIGDKQTGMEKSLREIARDKRYWEDKRTRIKKTDKYLEELTAKYEKELTELNENKKKIINEAKDEAKNILSGANKEIENTIRTIKESGADKEKTKEVRKQFEEFRDKVENTADNDDKIERQMQRILERKQRKATKDKSTEENITVNKTETVNHEQLKPGDKVKVAGHSIPGEVLKATTTNVSVAMGSLIINIKPNKVVRISGNVFKKATKENYTSSPADMEMSLKRLNFKPSIDVRGCRTIDALEQVTDLIDEAIMLGMGEVRILHGKGNGILKEEIRTFLRTYGKILTFHNEHEDSGGSGVTIVKFFTS